MVEAIRRKARYRVLSLVVYGAALATLQHLVVSTGLSPNQNAIWLYSGFASLLFGSRLLNPHFTPPADAATNAFMAAAALFAGSLVVEPDSLEAAFLNSTIGLCLFILTISVVVLLIRPATGSETRPLIRAADKAVRSLGSPVVIFTIVILICVWVFHRSQHYEATIILTAWAVIVVLRPIESILNFIDWANEQWVVLTTHDVIGEIAAYQSPNMVLIRQSGDTRVDRGTPMIVADSNGPWMLGVALNYVGRDEGILLRALTLELPGVLQNDLKNLAKGQTSGTALAVSAATDALAGIDEIEQIERLCGIVVSDANLEYLLFEVIEDTDLTEGRLVESKIGNHHVIFQIIDGLTREDIVQQKNTYGYARAKARKIGRWDRDAEKFTPVKWLPRINAPVFLLETTEQEISPNVIGHFPDTSFGVSVNISEAVTHNTAILGILGIGKSYLSIELVERMIADGIKVICLDLTNQYAELLSEFRDAAHDDRLDQELCDAGGRGEAMQSKEEGGSINQFAEKLSEQLANFVSEDGRNLRVINPAAFDVWRQTGFKDYKTGDASMASLSPAEITAMVSDAALEVCQKMGMTAQGRLCLVYEEAHSLVPEWNSVVAEGDKAATARSARAILQGRKYGLGCLLITQRTANVTKTILNQCNTIFAMRTFDDTGKEFLSNYIGRDYADILPSLEARHAVIFGKASSCENPVLVRLNDREPFLEAFRAEHPVPPLPIIDASAAAPQAVQDAARPIDVLDDEIPF